MKNIFSTNRLIVSFTVLLLFIIFGCSQKPKLVKPFVVIKIEYGSKGNEWYTYQDANGVRETFYTKRGTHNIGDTLK